MRGEPGLRAIADKQAAYKRNTATGARLREMHWSAAILINGIMLDDGRQQHRDPDGLHTRDEMSRLRDRNPGFGAAGLAGSLLIIP